MTGNQYLFPPPPRARLPLSKGGDLVVDFLQKLNGVYTNYGPGVAVSLVIDAAPPVSAAATISTYHALCKIESTAVDDIPIGTPWRCVVSYPTLPTTEVVAINGRTSRADK